MYIDDPATTLVLGLGIELMNDLKSFPTSLPVKMCLACCIDFSDFDLLLMPSSYSRLSHARHSSTTIPLEHLFVGLPPIPPSQTTSSMLPQRPRRLQRIPPTHNPRIPLPHRNLQRLNQAPLIIPDKPLALIPPSIHPDRLDSQSP